MKLLNTESEIASLSKLVLDNRHKLDATLFECKSSDPKNDAQRNLSGRTHYVDDDTLRWHKSRVLGCKVLADGLLLKITTSDSLDFHNTRRGFRVVVFDVFGTTVVRPDLEAATPTRKGAHKAFESVELDVVAHYREAMASKLRYAADTVAALHNIITAIDAGLTQTAAA